MAKGISHEKTQNAISHELHKNSKWSEISHIRMGKTAGNAFFGQKFTKTVDNCVHLMLY